MGYRLIPKGQDRWAGIPGERSDASEAAFKAAHQQQWVPPSGSRTFAEYDAMGARLACQRRPHVIIREDPMFGRRGYAKEIVADTKHGFLVLVVAFTTRKDSFGNWVEPIKPKDCDRTYWPPSKVEFA